METVEVAVHTCHLTWDAETGLKSESQPGLRSEFQTCLGFPYPKRQIHKNMGIHKLEANNLKFQKLVSFKHCDCNCFLRNKLGH